MNIDDLTLKQIEEIKKLIFKEHENERQDICDWMIGSKVIIRTYSAGVWFGTLDKKSGDEAILKDARRMWKWHTKKGISLSEVARYGINTEKSKITCAVDYLWLQPIEIIMCTKESILSIESAKDATAL